MTRRVTDLGRSLELPEVPAAAEEIRRVVTVFRELRGGVTEDGRTKLKTPSGTLSTAEAISVITNGIALAAHFGDGVLRAADVAAGIVGAVVKDPVADGVIWQEYLETVVRERDDWRDFYRAARHELDLARPPRRPRRPPPTCVLLGVRHHGPGSARAVRRALDAYRPDVVLIEGPPEADALVGLAAAEDMRPPVALLAYPADPKAGGGARRAASFWPFAEFSPEWQAIQWAVANGVPVRFCDLPAAVRYGRDRPPGTQPRRR